MLGSVLSVVATALLAARPSVAATQNPKRGLVYVPSPDAAVNEVWVEDGSPLSWYYNYATNITDVYASIPQSDFEFVPMLWGAVNDTSFLSNVTDLIKKGHNITHVLGFNQPELSWNESGSNIEPADAALIWVKNFLPLQEMGVKIGLPVVKAQTDPMPWMTPFLANCTTMLRKQEASSEVNCSYDFLTMHVFGNMSVLTGEVDKYAKLFPDTPIWITEYALDNADLPTTQAFFNESLKYLDESDIVERYSYFGSFRADVSNVGPNVTMIDGYGRLTDIGSWYLGGNATGNTPTYSGSSGSSGTGSSGSTCNATNPCGNDNSAGPVASGSPWQGLALLAAAAYFLS